MSLLEELRGNKKYYTFQMGRGKKVYLGPADRLNIERTKQALKYVGERRDHYSKIYDRIMGLLPEGERRWREKVTSVLPKTRGVINFLTGLWSSLSPSVEAFRGSVQILYFLAMNVGVPFSPQDVAKACSIEEELAKSLLHEYNRQHRTEFNEIRLPNISGKSVMAQYVLRPGKYADNLRLQLLDFLTLMVEALALPSRQEKRSEVEKSIER